MRFVMDQEELRRFTERAIYYALLKAFGEDIPETTYYHRLTEGQKKAFDMSLGMDVVGMASRYVKIKGKEEDQ